jgi:hypothetical protein
VLVGGVGAVAHVASSQCIVNVQTCVCDTKVWQVCVCVSSEKMTPAPGVAVLPQQSPWLCPTDDTLPARRLHAAVCSLTADGSPPCFAWPLAPSACPAPGAGG